MKKAEQLVGGPVAQLFSFVGVDVAHHQRTAPKVDGKEDLSAFAAFDRVHLNDSDIRVGSDEFPEVIVGASDMAPLIDADRLFLLANPVTKFPGEVDVSDGKKPCIDVVVDGLFIKHDVIGILDAYVMD